MTDNPDSLVLEHLRAIRGRVDKIDEGQDRLEHRLSTVEHHLAALVSAAAFDRGDLDSLRRRVERIEHRLELTD